jgi:uncharacterized protein YhhL (DUF1145 family)
MHIKHSHLFLGGVFLFFIVLLVVPAGYHIVKAILVLLIFVCLVLTILAAGKDFSEPQETGNRR